MARESDDDFQDDVVGESRVFDGFIIKPLIQDIIRKDPPGGQFKKKFQTDDNYSINERNRINREMLERVNDELLERNIDHPAITFNQMKGCVDRALKEEKRVRVKQGEWKERQKRNLGFQDDDDPFPFPDFEFFFTAGMMVKESEDNQQTRKFDGSMIKPIVEDIIRMDPPNGEFKKKFVSGDYCSVHERSRINKEMHERINNELIMRNIDHPPITLDQMKGYFAREEKMMRKAKQKEWQDWQRASCGGQDNSVSSQGIIGEESDDDILAPGGETRKLDGSIIKPLIRDIIRSDPPDGKFKRKFLMGALLSLSEKIRINKDMQKRINKELVRRNIDHHAITLNQMKDCIRRAEEEERGLREKQKEWQERNTEGNPNEDDPFPSPDYEFCFRAGRKKKTKTKTSGQQKKNKKGFSKRTRNSVKQENSYMRKGNARVKKTSMSNILGMRHIQYNEGDDHARFYRTFKSALCENLRREGDIYDGDIVLEDEILSPTFEDAIVVWSLERIHPMLPELVDKYFGHQFGINGVGISSVQDQVFKAVPMLLEGFENLADLTVVKMENDEVIYDNTSSDIKSFDAIPSKVDSIRDKKSIAIKKEAEVNDDAVDITNGDDNNSSMPQKPVKRVSNMINKQESDPITIKSESHLANDFQETFGMDYDDDDDDRDKDYVPNEKEINAKDHEIEYDDKTVREYDPMKKTSYKQPTWFSCPICSLRFTRKNLLPHMQLKHESENIEDYNLEDYRVMSEEIVKNENVKRIPCPICNLNIIANHLNVKLHFKRKHFGEVIDPEFLASIPDTKHVLNNSSGTEFNRIECPMCSTVLLAHRDNVKKHYLKQHRGTLPDSAWLARLPCKRKKTSDETEICTVCGEQVKRASMKSHMRKRHKINTYTEESSQEKIMCTICGEMKARRNIEMHAAKCAGGGGRQAGSRSKLLDRNLSCDSCKRHFFDEFQMKNHVCAHLQCELCEAKFIRIRNLKIHMKGHEGHKLFSCEACEALFLSRRSYLAHRRDIHDPKYQERKFKCDNCDADFKTRPALTKHIKIVHIGMGRNHRCEECDKAYKTKSQLLVHMHFKHTKHMFVKKCPDCDLEILSLGEYKQHRERTCKVLKKVPQGEESTSAVSSIQFEMKVF